MARRFSKKSTSPPKHLRIDVTRIKQDCICALNGLCVCPPMTNGQVEIKNGEKVEENNSSTNSPLR